MPTIYSSTAGTISGSTDNETVTITRDISVGGLTSNWNSARLNNLGSVIGVTAVFGSNSAIYNYQWGLIFNSSNAVVSSVSIVPGTGINNKIYNYGDIVSTGGYGVTFSHTPSGGVVENGGSIISETRAAIYTINAVLASITNSGSLQGYDGIVLEGKVTHTGINNSGTIAARNYAIHTEGGNSFSLHNTGTINGFVGAAGSASDSIVNFGRMLSNAALGSGDDTYTGAGSGFARGIFGEAGDDKLTGSAAADIFSGGNGDDRLNGGGGNDRLSSGSGRDYLTGGAGADTFRYIAVTDSTVSSTGRDTIYDFTRGQDKIDLSAIDANGSAAGLGAFRFIGGAAFIAGVQGQVRLSYANLAGTANDKTYIFADLNGDRVPDFAITLTGLKALTATDFLL